jgi:peptidoglycan/xylan/chitin deacetylase (PgdA/CDA1 family)
VVAAALVVAALAVAAARPSLRSVPVAEPRPPAPSPAVAHRAHARRPSLHRRELAAVERAAARLPFLAGGGRRRREVALTFDDGPGPYTLAVVHALERRHVPATFFQVGSQIPEFPAVERALARGGFALGDHTETHPDMALLPAAAQLRQVEAEREQARRAGVLEWRLFRPPWGAMDAATRRILRRARMLPVLWTIDSRDYLRPGSAAIVARVLRLVRPGAIVLMHDGGGDRAQTVAALPAIVRALRRRHFRLVTVPRLLADEPPPHRQTAPPTGTSSPPA